MIKSKRVDLWKCCFTYVILMFPGVVGSISGARKREKRSANSIWIPTRFCDDFRSILEAILHPKTLQGSMRNFIWVRAKKMPLSPRKGDAIWGGGGLDPGLGWDAGVWSKNDAKVCWRLGGRAFRLEGDGLYPLIVCMTLTKARRTRNRHATSCKHGGGYVSM